MTPYLDQSPVAGLVFDLSVVVFAVAEIAQTLRLRRGVPGDVRSEVVFRVGFFAGIIVLPIAARFVPQAQLGGGAVVFVLGAGVAWLGALLRWWSFVTLGSLFTTVVKVSADQAVVDRGPYRVLRHPAYTGLLLIFIGCGVMLGNGVGLAASVLLILAALVYRLLREERTLTATLGQPYRDFANGRARLVPYLW